jgi:hypothetical protein
MGKAHNESDLMNVGLVTTLWRASAILIDQPPPRSVLSVFHRAANTKVRSCTFPGTGTGTGTAKGPGYPQPLADMLRKFVTAQAQWMPLTIDANTTTAQRCRQRSNTNGRASTTAARPGVESELFNLEIA